MKQRISLLFVFFAFAISAFGQVDNISSQREFLLFGVGGLAVPTIALITLFWVKRRDWF